MEYKLVVGLAAALASSLFVTAAAKAANDSAVTIAVGVDPAFTPFFVADARELFKKYGLNVQIQQHANGGVDAILGDNNERLARSRAEVRATMGDAALVDAAAIAATFNAIDRIADSTGIPIEDANIDSTAELRNALGINAFAEDRGEIIDRRSGGIA